MDDEDNAGTLAIIGAEDDFKQVQKMCSALDVNV